MKQFEDYYADATRKTVSEILKQFDITEEDMANYLKNHKGQLALFLRDIIANGSEKIAVIGLADLLLGISAEAALVDEQEQLLIAISFKPSGRA